MGAPQSEPKRQDDEGPVHLVDIEERFAIGVYETSFEEWDACLRGGGCSGYRPWDEGWGRGSRPVINVSWRDAQAYVRWLSHLTGATYRLPSEPEWEYAARAGTSGPFSFGAIAPSKANYNAQSSYNGSLTGKVSFKTQPVGTYDPNAFGLYDVHGNVAEWVEDCPYQYRNEPRGNAPIVENCGNTRVKRGGSWDIEAGFVRSASRNWGYPADRWNVTGFRVVREIE